ncbi:hypothetical protein [Kitasatospora sp. NPDC088346]|uniref:hypothetical protein n=1 Tax=Kitasatospora sp. NPDC088346 TaxID=3364073 RepID=UPI003803B7EE
MSDRAGSPVVLAEAHWPPPDDPDARPDQGRFLHSRFPPLIAATAEACLRLHYGEPPAPAGRGRRTAVLLSSLGADRATAARVAEAVGAGAQVAKPLLFQSAPTAALGLVTARWGLAGPMLSITPLGDRLKDALALAGRLLAVGEAAEVLLVCADLADRPGTPDRAQALLLGPPARTPAPLTPPPRVAPPPARPPARPPERAPAPPGA